MISEQHAKAGCLSVKCFKRFYTIDGITLGQPPRPLTRIVKCVKYYSCWAFDSSTSYGAATKWYFDTYMKELQRLLLAPFDVSCGDSL